MSRREWIWLAVLLAAVVVRVATLTEYPLNDTTEARYAEIGREMAETGDWITPRIAPDTPFWGKPPLSFWLTAASFSALGLGEFAARFPSFLLALASGALVFGFARRIANREAAIAAVAIMITSLLGFVVAGAVMTDASLLLSTTLAMVAFWNAAVEEQRAWRYPFFLALALGLLAKGPVALVMTGMPIGAWWLLSPGSTAAVRRIPWVSGTAITLAIAIPWYVLAELRTPGFLEYFFVGEHFLRFVDSGWQGDLYGEAHAHARGMIWIFALGAALPWSIVAAWAGARQFAGDGLRSTPPLQRYLLLWAITPMLFFSLAGNILPTYVLTGLPAFAILLATWLTSRNVNLAHLGWIAPATVCALLALPGVFDTPRSQSEIVAYQQSIAPATSLYYYRRKPHSADFYSRGQALLIDTPAELTRIMESPGAAFIAIKDAHLDDLPAGWQGCLSRREASARYVLLEKQALPCAGPNTGARHKLDVT
jgi:4-amino-4-deoxy-L-arabinose transferase-like glycosyltransferase